jgi:hypothetical protein
MSSNKISPYRFDKYIPLFGRKNDNRVRLFLHTLEKVALQNMKNDSRSELELQDVRFITKKIPFYDKSQKYMDVKDFLALNYIKVINDVSDKSIPGKITMFTTEVEKVNKPTDESSEGIVYNHAQSELGSDNLLTLQPTISHNSSNKWEGAISQDPLKTNPFINDDNWNNRDTLSLDPTSDKFSQDSIHSEWVKFFGQFMLRIADSTEKKDETNKIEILSIINNLSGTKQTNSIEHFMQLVVKLLFKNLNGTHENLYIVSTWDKINKYTYEDVNNLFYNFHLYNFIVVSNLNHSAKWFKNDESRFLSITNCLNAAIGIPLYQLSEPGHNKPYHILTGNKLFEYPQYNYAFYSNSLIASSNNKILINLVINFCLFRFAKFLHLTRTNNINFLDPILNLYNTHIYRNFTKDLYKNIYTATEVTEYFNSLYILNDMIAKNNQHKPKTQEGISDEEYEDEDHEDDEENDDTIGIKAARIMLDQQAEDEGENDGAGAGEGEDDGAGAGAGADDVSGAFFHKMPYRNLFNLVKFSMDDGDNQKSIDVNENFNKHSDTFFIYNNKSILSYIYIISNKLACVLFYKIFEFIETEIRKAREREHADGIGQDIDAHEEHILQYIKIMFTTQDWLIPQIKDSLLITFETITADLPAIHNIRFHFNQLSKLIAGDGNEYFMYNFIDKLNKLLVRCNSSDIQLYYDKLKYTYSKYQNKFLIDDMTIYTQDNDYKHLELSEDINIKTNKVLDTHKIDHYYQGNKINHVNIISLLANNGCTKQKNKYEFKCYKEQKDNTIRHEKLCLTYKHAFIIVYKLLDMLQTSQIHDVYKRNINYFKQFLESKFNDSNYLSSIGNSIPVHGIKSYLITEHYKYFMEKILPEIIKEFNDKNYEGQQQISFDYKFDKYYTKILDELETEQDEDIVSIINEKDPLSFFDSLINIETGKDTYKNIFIRKSDGKLYKKNANGEFKSISKGSDEYNSIKRTNKCRTTQIKETSNLKCYEYLNDCLMGKNFKGCKRFLSNSDFWPTSVEEINEMHPSEIINTLLAFKFQVVSIFDKEVNMSLNFFENIEQWKNSLDEKRKLDKTHDDYLTDDEYNAIIGNTRLFFYLKKLIEKINTNPGILNKNYNENVISGFNYDSKNKTRLEHYGVQQGQIYSKPYTTLETVTRQNPKQQQKQKSKPEDIFNMLSDLGNLKGIFSTRGGANIKEDIYSMDGGSNIVVRSSFGPNSLPSMSVIPNFSVLKQNMQQTNYKTSGIIEKLYLEVLNKLKTINKDISPSQNESILKHINDLKEKEQKLSMMISYINKYIDLYEIYGDNDNSILTIENITKYLNKHNKVLQKTNIKRSDLVSLIETIAETFINKMGVTSDDNKTNNGRPTTNNGRPTTNNGRPLTNNEIKSLFD